MKYIDLYAGIGGFRQAMDHFGHECVFTAEIDPSAIQTYEENYNDKAAFNLDSLQEMTDNEINEKIPDHDILTGGFPCQPFSVGGKREGFSTLDTKGTQFFNILKILDIKKPKYIFLENVKNLFSHDSGRTWKIIREELGKRGYQMPEKEIILSPSDFGIPQNRPRVFIIGSKISKPKEFEFEKQTKQKSILKHLKSNEKLVISDELEKTLESWGEFIQNVKFPEGRTLPVIWIDYMKSNNVIDKDWPDWKKKYINDMTSFYIENKSYIDSWMKKHNCKEWSKRDKKLEWQAGKDNKNIRDSIITLRQSGIRCKSYPIFPTLVAMVQTPIIWDKNLSRFREISTREAANLQSFPENFKINPIKFQAYKQFGNAVNVDVIKNLVEFYFNK